jgi:hypothetical protein
MRKAIPIAAISITIVALEGGIDSVSYHLAGIAISTAQLIEQIKFTQPIMEDKLLKVTRLPRKLSTWQTSVFSALECT